MTRTATKGPLSNAERQRRFRERRDARLAEFEQLFPSLRNDAMFSRLPALRNVARTSLRNDTRPGARNPLRNDTRSAVTAETIDDALTQLRQHLDQLTAAYVALLTTPGLTTAETKTVHARFIKSVQLFDASVKTTRPAHVEMTRGD